MNKKYIIIAIAVIGLSAGVILALCSKGYSSCEVKKASACEIKKQPTSCCANKPDTSKKCASDHAHKSGDSCTKKEAYSTNHTNSSQQKTAPIAPSTPRESLSVSFFNVQKALSKDDLSSAILYAKQLNKISLSEHEQSIASSAKTISSSPTIYKARAEFEALSKEMETFYKTNGTPSGQMISKYHCPMAKKNKGASWLQNSEGVQNPYFGASMYHCGSKTKSL